jgi:hypothetical protein
MASSTENGRFSFRPASCRTNLETLLQAGALAGQAVCEMVGAVQQCKHACSFVMVVVSSTPVGSGRRGIIGHTLTARSNSSACAMPPYRFQSAATDKFAETGEFRRTGRSGPVTVANKLSGSWSGESACPCSQENSVSLIVITTPIRPIVIHFDSPCACYAICEIRWVFCLPHTLFFHRFLPIFLPIRGGGGCQPTNLRVDDVKLRCRPASPLGLSSARTQCASVSQSSASRTSSGVVRHAT